MAKESELFAVKTLCVGLLFSLSASTWAGGGQLLGTAGVTSIEGSAGGGLIPWATLGSYASRDEYGLTVATSETNVDDYRLSVYGFTVNARDRVELSLARMDFRIDTSQTLIRQSVAGIKVRAMGDLVYGELPLVSLGLHYKSLTDKEVARAVGAEKTKGVDLYVSAAKAWIDGIAHRTTFANVNLRYSDANELGLLGYGGDDAGSKFLLEAAAGLFLTQQLAVGAEFRQKRNHLSAFDEDNWMDVFVAWFPSKSLALTAAWARLGEIAGSDQQDGLYFALQGSF